MTVYEYSFDELYEFPNYADMASSAMSVTGDFVTNLTFNLAGKTEWDKTDALCVINGIAVFESILRVIEKSGVDTSEPMDEVARDIHTRNDLSQALMDRD